MSGESARISALGINNYVAKKKDPHSLLANPAGLADLEDTELLTTYEDRFSGDLINGTFGMTLKNIGFKIDYMDISGIEKRDETGEKVGDISFDQFNASVCWGFSLNKSLSCGVGLNFLSKFADNRSSFGGSIDLGAMYKASDNITLGGMAENIGVQSSLNEQGSAYSSPIIYRVGGQWSPIKNLNILGGGAFSEQFGFVWSAGSEYVAFDCIALRVGYDSGQQSYGALTSGIGVNINDIFQIDYAFKSHPSLGSMNILTLTIKFKNEIKEQAKEKIEEKVKEEIKEEPKKEVKEEPQKEIQPPPQIIAEKPVKIDLGDNKYLNISAGWATFKLGRSEIADLTDSGKEAIGNAQELIRYVYSLGLAETDVAVIIEGSASAEGDPRINEKLSDERAQQGKQFLLEALSQQIDTSLLEVQIVPLGATQSKKLEAEYMADWQQKHNGGYPSKDDLENFRQGCRNFKIKIKINMEKWPDYQNNQDVISKINKLSEGLSGQLDNAYKTAVEKKKQGQQ